jgi:hypothetical protein
VTDGLETEADVNIDGKIGLEEAVRVLQIFSADNL